MARLLQLMTILGVSLAATNLCDANERQKGGGSKGGHDKKQNDKKSPDKNKKTDHHHANYKDKHGHSLPRRPLLCTGHNHRHWTHWNWDATRKLYVF